MSKRFFCLLCMIWLGIAVSTSASVIYSSGPGGESPGVLGGETEPSILGTGVVISNSLGGTIALTLYETTLLGDSRHPPTGASPIINNAGWGTTAAPTPYLGLYDVSAGDELFFNGGEMITFEYLEQDITGASIYYQIDDGPYSLAYSLDFNEDLGGGEKRWYSESYSDDLLAGLDNGLHTISVYYEAESATQGTITENNGGAFFAAEFETVPEPAVIGLILIFGTSTLVIRRIFYK